jgi:hypothetical protein
VRKLFPLLILALILTQAYAQPAIPRHANPDQLKPAAPDPVILTGVYGDLSSAFLAENFSSIASLASVLLNLSAPSDLKFILDRFHSLIQEEGILMNYSKTGLEVAKQLALQGRVSDALSYIENVTMNLAKANITYMSLADAARTVKGRTGAETGSLLQSILKLIVTYTHRLNETSTLLGANLTDTQLTLSITPTSAWVGSKVLAYGYLKNHQGDPLPNRTIVLMMDGRKAAETITNEQGYYSLSLQVPYIYVEHINLFAMYLPLGGDVYKYKPAISPNATLYLLYVTPNITLSIQPDLVLPGDTIQLRASIDHPVPTLDAYLFGQHFKLQVQNGSATLALSVPTDAPEGKYIVIVSSPANQTIAPTSTSGTLTVKKLSINITQLQIPMFLSPLTSTLNTCITFEREPTPYTLEVSIPSAEAQASTASTTTCTQVEIKPGLLTPTGTIQGTITVHPRDPRYKTASAKFQAYNINLLLLVFALTLVTSSLYVYLKAGTRKRELQAEREEEKPTPIVVHEPPPRVEAEENSPVHIEINDPIAKEYFRAVKIVETATGIKMKPSNTISEYLSETRSRLGKAGDIFREISSLAEAKLYGDIPVDVDKLATLVSELEKILEEKKP